MTPPGLTQEETRLLVVDDDPVVLKLLKAILSKHYPKISIASSGSEALKFLSQVAYDCVITDAIMPQTTGYDLARSIRNHPQWEHLPIIMLTRKSHPEDVQKAIKAGVNDYLLKPVDETLLLEKVGLSVRRTASRREVFELDLLSSATLSTDVMIRRLSEAGLEAALPFSLKPQARFQLDSPLFAEIGITPPQLKVIDCRENTVDPKFPFIVRFTFIAAIEADLMKIRSYLQREEIRRRK